MSSRSARAAAVTALAAVALGGVGCWEQLDDGKWFPQMKRQRAVQAFEEMPYGYEAPFVPPEGAVPIDGGEPPVGRGVEAEADTLVNPRAADLASLENGRDQYGTFCATCHGATGLADGPVARKFLGVLPLVGVVKARSDGHIYATIRYGRRRMPSYQRIPAQDRWDIVNYVRYLDQKGGRP